MTPLRIEQLQQIMPASGARATRFLNPLNSAMAEFGIDMPKRMAAFLAQLAHESGNLRYMRELWGPTAAQQRYERDFSAAWPPVNKGDRNQLPFDLGNSEPGDGYRFMGRGPIQTTGRRNYISVGKALGLDLVSNPEHLEIPEVGCRAAGYFWLTKGLNALADAGEWEAISKRVNGGYNGMQERLKYTQLALEVLHANS